VRTGKPVLPAIRKPLRTSAFRTLGLPRPVASRTDTTAGPTWKWVAVRVRQRVDQYRPVSFRRVGEGPLARQRLEQGERPELERVEPLRVGSHHRPIASARVSISSRTRSGTAMLNRTHSEPAWRGGSRQQERLTALFRRSAAPCGDGLRPGPHAAGSSPFWRSASARASAAIASRCARTGMFR